VKDLVDYNPLSFFLSTRSTGGLSRVLRNLLSPSLKNWRGVPAHRDLTTSKRDKGSRFGLRAKELRRSVGTLLLPKGLPEKDEGLLAISYFSPYLFFPNTLKDVAYYRAGFIPQPHHVPPRDKGRGAHDLSPLAEGFDSMTQLNHFLVSTGYPIVHAGPLIQEGEDDQQPHGSPHVMDKLPQVLLAHR
jgi:hypothetical protein